MEEAAKADYVAIIDNGIISAKGTPSDLRTKYSTNTLRLIPKETNILTGLLRKEGIRFTISGDSLFIEISKTLNSLPLVNKVKDLISDFEVLTGSMDDAFVKITGHAMREDGNK
jgi:multidrug/hemolysin transport system ATP-binding protein